MRLVTPLRTSLTAASLLFVATGPLAAQQAAAPKAWENTVTLYGWAAAMSGTTGVGPATASVDVSFSEILDMLKMGAMLNYQGRGEKWVAAADFIYMKLGSDVATPRTGVTVASIRVKEWMLEADGGYRVTPWLDALVGIRIPILEAEITPDVNIPSASEKSSTQSWVAPVIGARAVLPFGKKFTGIVRGDVGGFDLGGTNTTWQAAGYVNYAFGKGWSGTVGYRDIYVNYKSSDSPAFEYDMNNFGPVFGLGYTF
jgi:hypothetical protein